MNELLALIAEFAYFYGKNGAGIPSQHGSYEGEVPQVLRDGDGN